MIFIIYEKSQKMKKSQFKQAIKEEIRKVLKKPIKEASNKETLLKIAQMMKSANESVNESDNWKTVKTKSGDTLKPGKKYKMPRYDGEITFIRFDRDNKTLHLKSNKIGKIRTSIDNVKDMELVESVNEDSKAEDLLKQLYKQRAKAAAKGQTGLVSSLHKQIEKLVKSIKKNESVNEAKKVDAKTMMKMFKNKADWGDTADQVYMKGGKMVYVDTWFYGQDKALKQLVDSWKPGGHNYDYWFKTYGVKAKITDTFSEIRATGRHKKLTSDGIVGVVLDITPGIMESVNEGKLPKKGSIVKLNKDINLISYSNLKGQKLTVIGTKKTGLISEPIFLVVKDEKGKKHEINPDYISESVNEATNWPREVEAYDKDVIFRREKIMGNKAKYQIINKKTNKVIEPKGRIYTTLNGLSYDAGDYILPKGGTQSSRF